MPRKGRKPEWVVYFNNLDMQQRLDKLKLEDREKYEEVITRAVELLEKKAEKRGKD